MSRFDLVIFDCDGVLVDSERLAVRTESQILTELGWPLTEAEVIERFVGRSAIYMQAVIEEKMANAKGGVAASTHDRGSNVETATRGGPFSGRPGCCRCRWYRGCCRCCCRGRHWSNSTSRCRPRAARSAAAAGRPRRAH